MYCLLEYLFIVRKWKKRAKGQVHKQPWERKETRRVARSRVFSLTEAQTPMNVQDGYVYRYLKIETTWVDFFSFIVACSHFHHINFYFTVFSVIPNV